MATRQNDESDATKIIGSISKMAGTVAGSLVFTGKRIILTLTPSTDSSPDGPAIKSAQAPAKTKKKAVQKRELKAPKVKKKKAVKRKPAGSSGKSRTSKKKSTQSPAKKKKSVISKKKTISRKTKKATTSKAQSS